MFLLFIFYNKKKIGNQTCSPYFSSFLEQKTVFKNSNQIDRREIKTLVIHLDNLILMGLKHREHRFGTALFLFLKTIFSSQKQGEQEKHEEHVWFSVFYY